MKQIPILLICAALASGANAQTDTIDISGNNTSDSYVSYDKAITLPAGKTVSVKMARYCYFSSAATGEGTLNLFAGGERGYLGTAKGAAWPDWTNFTGDINIYPFPENAPSAGFYGVVLAHGGKAFSPENIENALKSGKVNQSMANNRVTLHSGATICSEANTAGSGFRIGELQTEAGSSIIGYMKKNTRAVYFIVGGTGTDATLAGTIAPPDYSDTHPVGLIKEGKGTYCITGNHNYLSGALRILEGRVLVENDRAEAEADSLPGALGARPDASEAIAYVMEDGTLGGTGSIGGTVINFGTIEPGCDSVGTLTISNFQKPSMAADLVLSPASVLRFKMVSSTVNDQLIIGGNVRYSNVKQDFSTSDAVPVIDVVPGELQAEAGAEFTVLTAKGKAGDWQFRLRQPGRYTWELVEASTDSLYTVKLRISSLDNAPADIDDEPEIPVTEPTMGAFYNDGIDDKADNNTLRFYAEKNGKMIGTAISTWKNDVGNANLAETKEIAAQFNMLVAENEMKFDALEPSRNQFSYSGADKLVSFAQKHGMTVRGHCLVWHQQQPEWVSSDGKKNDKNWSRSEALAIMKNHIDNVLRHFDGKVAEWDVVNECLDDDQSIVRSNPDGYTLRKNVWQQAIGDDYIDSAFVYARRAAPSILLYLNDYDVEIQGKAKSVAFYNLVKRLQQSNIPIDGVGLQCHFSNGDVDSLKLDGTIKRFGEAGLKCIITELDMGTPSSSAADLEEQARNYRVITDIMLNNDNCPSMVIWGLKDNDSWRSSSNPLLYTSSLSRKPAWYAVRSALRHRVPYEELSSSIRQAEIEPSADGTIYDIFGRPATQPLRPGVYIKNGKKFVIIKQ